MQEEEDEEEGEERLMEALKLCTLLKAYRPSQSATNWRATKGVLSS